MADNLTPPEILAADSVDELDNFPECFRCCVCLELLYKPVVLECGHVSCFWCAYHAMSNIYISHCPLCRNPYRHFPSICQLLHFLMLKLFPDIYEKRKRLLLKEEKDTGWFSPELSFSLVTGEASIRKGSFPHQCHSSSGEELRYLTSVDVLTGQPQNFSKITAENESSQAIMQNPQSINDVGDDFCASTDENERSSQISVTDVLCVSCQELLFQPVVLNCGHVYCKSCLVPMNGSLLCQVCQSPHPGHFPKVCLELDHILEEKFSKDYSVRREMLHLKLVNHQKELLTGEREQVKQESETCSERVVEDSMIEDSTDFSGHGGSMVNAGVGCDSCGMCPIIGKWYRCMDCIEIMGFDVCGSCYDTKSKLPGRFNQQHTADHRLKLVETNRIRHLFLHFTTSDIHLLASNEFLNGHLSSDESQGDQASAS